MNPTAAAGTDNNPPIAAAKEIEEAEYYQLDGLIELIDVMELDSVIVESNEAKLKLKKCLNLVKKRKNLVSSKSEK